MKRALPVIALLAFLFPAFAYAGPEMSFETFKHDFGSVTSGEQLHHEFKFSNSGDEDLQITRLSPS
jgi:hypothetical protein